MNDRMKVTCTEEKFIEIITYYNIKILKKEELKTTDEIFKIMIKNMFMQTKKNLIILSLYCFD